MSDMVHRKLSGVFMHLPLEVPYETYDHYISEMHEALTHQGVEITKAELSELDDITANFEKEVDGFIRNVLVDYWEDIGDAWEDAEKFFREEIKVAKAAKAERERQERIKAEAEAKARRADAKQLKVSSQNLEKARAILQAAGLLE